MSKFSSADDEDIKHWVMPEVKGKILGYEQDDVRPQTVEDIEALQKQAYEEAYQQGLAAGKKDGLAEMQAKARELTGMFQFLEKPLETLDEDVEQQLTELAFSVGRLLFKKEFSTEAAYVQSIIHEALDFLPVNSRQIKVRLNPADIENLQQAGIDPQAQDWTCIEDSSVSQGGCLVESDQSHIDASLESRVQQLFDQLTEHRPHYDDED